MRRAGVFTALVAGALCAACRARPPSPDASPVVAEATPPSRPANVSAVAHLGRPRTTFETLGDALGVRRPPDLVLVAALGVDVAVVAAVDTSRPIEVVALGEAHAGYAFALTPSSASHARSQLATRYRFIHADGLGERLVLRGDPGLSASERRVPCALVRVPSTVSSRVVCASDEATLTAAGRWIAYESAARASALGDFEATIEGDGARSASESLRAMLAGVRPWLSVEASTARRAHERPPDYGDPEVMVTELAGLTEPLVDALRTVQRATLRADVSRTRVDLTADLTLPPDGSSFLSADARDRSAVALEHPVAAMLPADALFAFADRVAATSRVATINAITAAALRVLGDRVTLPTAARSDLDALFAQSGDDLALAAARDAPEGVEVSFALSQRDGGVGARATLARLTTAPWLRALRIGAAPTVTPLRDGVLLASTVVPGAPPTPSLAIGVRAGALMVVLGRHARSTLDAAALRSTASSPALLASLRGSVVGALDLSALGLRDLSPLHFTYGAQRAPTALTATLRASIPSPALALALTALADR